MVEKGDRVTALCRAGRLAAGRVYRAFPSVFLVAFPGDAIWNTYNHVDEGTLWCRGHEGLAVEALEAVVALRRA
jgi:hypothetical protein